MTMTPGKESSEVRKERQTGDGANTDAHDDTVV